MNPPRILIVGAGAMGMVTGYHLSLAGVAVTFYVRPARLAELHGPQRLYCYDDATLKEFSNYQVITTIAAADEHDQLRGTAGDRGCEARVRHDGPRTGDSRSTRGGAGWPGTTTVV